MRHFHSNTRAKRRRTAPSTMISRRTAVAGLGAAAGRLIGLGATSTAAASLGLPLAAVMPAFDVNAAPLSYELKPKKIADGIWYLAGVQEDISRDNGGAIANIAILDTRDGAIVVDTGPSKRYGLALSDLATNLTGKPVVRAYLTHFHPDHVFGNQAFGPGVVAAPQPVIDGLKQLGEDFASAMYYTVGDWMRGTEVVLPETIVADDVEEIGGRRLRLSVLKGHTDCDLAVFDETSGTMFTGDLTFLDRAPTTPHADLAAWRASLDDIAEADGSMRTLMPGHGPVDRPADAIEQTRSWLDMVEDRVRGAFDKGLTMTEAFQEPLPAWTSNIALARHEFTRSVMHLYPKLEAGNWPRVDTQR